MEREERYGERGKNLQRMFSWSADEHVVLNNKVMFRSISPLKPHLTVRLCHTGVKLKSPGEVDITLSNG